MLVIDCINNVTKLLDFVTIPIKPHRHQVVFNKFGILVAHIIYSGAGNSNVFNILTFGLAIEVP